jgi:hypothetical protein
MDEILGKMLSQINRSENSEAQYYIEYAEFNNIYKNGDFRNATSSVK